jgi:CheY-like chemotaxis protein/two-component sensor histidine kinase
VRQDSELVEALRDARDGADRVRIIVRDLKTFSRAQEDLRTCVDVQRVLESSLRMAWNEVRHRARLVKQYTPVPAVEANESRLGQVFLNLIVNAAQAIGEGHADKNEIRLRTRSDALGRVIVEVEDTGPGIGPEVMRRLFTPFFTTKQPGVGTGLGLSICHRIVTGLGGEIVVDSEIGRGTMFRIVLPAASNVAVSEESTPPPVSRVAARRGRVLIVDDDPIVGSAVRRIVGSEHDVVTLTSAQEALARISAGERFDVVVCDLMMPVMTGVEFYEELSIKSPEHARRIVFLTGGAFTAKTRQFLDQVPNPRLDKPFEAQDLRALVSEMLSGASAENCRP